MTKQPSWRKPSGSGVERLLLILSIIIMAKGSPAFGQTAGPTLQRIEPGMTLAESGVIPIKRDHSEIYFKDGTATCNAWLVWVKSVEKIKDVRCDTIVNDPDSVRKGDHDFSIRREFFLDFLAPYSSAFGIPDNVGPFGNGFEASWKNNEHGTYQLTLYSYIGVPFLLRFEKTDIRIISDDIDGSGFSVQ